MTKRISARMIIIENHQILLFKRKRLVGREIQEYYAIPGGGLENQESLLECVVRELQEEMQIETEVLGYLGYDETSVAIEHFFHGKRVSGVPVLGGEELIRNSSVDSFEIVWIDLDAISAINLWHIDKIERASTGKYLEFPC